MSLTDDFIEIITHDQPSLTDDSANEDQGGDDLEGDDFEIELDEADAGGPVEGFPGVEHGDAAAAADDGGLDSAAEAAVEGDDGFVFLWEHRCLHAGQGDLGGEDDGEDDEESHQAADKDLADVTGEDLWSDFTVVGRVLGVAFEAVGAEHESRNVEGKLLGSGPDGCGEEDLASSLEAGEAAPPALGTRVAHDNVGPGHVEAAEDGVSDDSEKRMGEWGSAKAAEKIEEQGIGHVVDDGDV